MKLIMSAAALFLSTGAVPAAEATSLLHVTGLTCPSCSYIVATSLKRVQSVEIAEFIKGEAEDGLYLLRYDDAVTDADALIATVTGLGYGATLAAEDG